MSTVGSPLAPDSQPSDDEDDETQSLTESVLDYPREWGRRYHKYKEGSYLYPNDEPESERLDMQHHLFRLLHGDKIFFAPLKNPKRILDIGTGTGIWAIEMAHAFPNARITGTDLSAIQPCNVPPNVSFEIDDCSENDWARPLASIDYIHTAVMLGALTSFPKLISTARRYLKPGSGWLECHELLPKSSCDDGTIPPGWPMSEWENYWERAGLSVDPPRPTCIADKISTWMHQAGFVDIHERVDKIPLNSWPKDPTLKQIGRHWEMNWVDGISAFSYKLFGREGLGWTKEEIEVFLVGVRRAIKDRTVHAYQKVYVVYGRRPSEEEEKAMRQANGLGKGAGKGKFTSRV